jgi:sulfite reductase (NADPH) flavoprotein alpha-component
MLAPLVVEKVMSAAVLVLAYIVLCVAVYWQYRRRHSPVMVAPETWLIAYATQTGYAHHLAQHTARTLREAGLSVQELPLSQLTAAMLQQAEQLLLIVSTYGNGEAPDSARLFVRRVMAQALPLTGLRYGLLALGSRHYPQFCAFGGELDAWLQTQGAQAYFDYIRVDNSDKQAISLWGNAIAECTHCQNVMPDTWQQSAFSPWIIHRQQLLNPNSLGAPVYYLQLTPVNPSHETWQAGDLIQLYINDEQPLRDYSIANVTADHIALLVRLQQRPECGYGLGSGMLTQSALGTEVALRIRQNPSFHIANNQHRPLVLIANGTGLAGVLAHLRQRAVQINPRPCWLIFGERQRAVDYFCQQELAQYQRQGLLTRLDVVFSRDGEPLRYVQDVLMAQASELQQWLAQDAAIYICGSLQGMAQAVDESLKRLIGQQHFDRLSQEGRYKRDVY